MYVLSENIKKIIFSNKSFTFASEKNLCTCILHGQVFIMWLKFQLIRDIIDVLFTAKNDGDVRKMKALKC